MVRLVDDGWDEDRDIDEVEWCPPFSIDQVDDFQTELILIGNSNP